MEEKVRYTSELIKDFLKRRNIFYKQRGLLDLCAGPHLPSTEGKAFKLLSVEGAIGGSEKNKKPRNITDILHKKAMDDYITSLKNKKNHNKWLVSLNCSTVINSKLPILMPKGAKIIQILQRFVETKRNAVLYAYKDTFMAKMIC